MAVSYAVLPRRQARGRQLTVRCEESDLLWEQHIATCNFTRDPPYIWLPSAAIGCAVKHLGGCLSVPWLHQVAGGTAGSH